MNNQTAQQVVKGNHSGVERDGVYFVIKGEKTKEAEKEEKKCFLKLKVIK